MNYFVEGLQGSGKSTMVRRLANKLKGYQVFCEGDYSPVELAWCAYVPEETYQDILKMYAEIAPEIEQKTFAEDTHRIICYTQILTDIPQFHQHLAQYEIYNNRIGFEEFESIILKHYQNWQGDAQIFECSIFQNIVEDLILYRCMPDEEILCFYKKVKAALEHQDYKIVYLVEEDIKNSIEIIKEERVDTQGNEMWFPLMLRYFESSPFAERHGLKNMGGLVKHLEHRQELEIRLCREVFGEHVVEMVSKKDEEKINGGTVKIRAFRPDDYDDVYALWLRTLGMGLNDVDDSREGITRYLKRNP